ncbi:MAG: AMP-binding protein [Candidatus Thermoplasmatota archaeon]|nr:AMP-binding protein [Candidatus Thermoplasmatota archaeon]
MQQGMDIGLTLDRLFYQTLLRSPEKKIHYKGMSTTYHGLFQNVKRFSSAISAKYGDRKAIGVLDWNTIPYMQMLFGIPLSGNVIHPVNMRLPPEEMIRTISMAKDEVLFFSDEFLPLVRKIEEMKIIRRDNIYVINDGSPSGYNSYADLMKTGSEGESFTSHETDTASILFTSGTTGKPKQIAYTHKKTTLAIWGILTLLSAYPGNSRINSTDVIFSLIPNYHLWSWGTPYVATMIGADYVMDGRFDLQLTMDAIRRNKVTWMSMVPTMLYGILSHPDAADLSGLKVLVGGSPIPSGIVKAASDKGIELTSIYGFSDGLIAGIGSLSENVPDLYERNTLSTSGVIPAPLSEYRIRKSNDGKIGEINFRSPWLPNGYVGDDEKTAESFDSERWFITGDAGYILDGKVQISDRLKDLIKSGAEFIPSAMVESVMSDIPEIESVAIVGFPDKKWGERPIAYIKTKQGMTVEDQYILSHLVNQVKEGKMQKWWIPDKFIRIDAMPLTGTGKIDKKKLRNMVGE